MRTRGRRKKREEKGGRVKEKKGTVKRKREGN